MQGLTCHRAVEVLQAERDAAERPVRKRTGGIGAGPIEAGVNHRVEFRVHALDAFDCRLDEIGGLDVAGTDESRLRGGVEGGELVDHAGNRIVARCATRSPEASRG